MRLRNLLTIPDLRLELVTGHDELDRTIRRVVTTDLRDPGRYLSGGELVLSGLVWHTRAADTEIFVKALTRAGVCALAAWDVEAATIPADLIDACRRHGLPLLRVPEDVAFASITEQVMRRLSTARAADLAAVLGRHRRLVADVSRGGGLGPLLDLVGRDMGMRSWVLAPPGRLIAGSPDLPRGLALADLVRGFLTASHLPAVLPGHDLSIFPVAPDTTSRVADWLLVCEGDWTEWPPERQALTSELTAIVAIERARSDERLSVLAQELVRLVVAGAAMTEIRPRLELAGLDPASVVAVAASVAARADGSPRPEELCRLLREILPAGSAVGLLDGGDDEVVALVPAAVSGHDVAGEIRQALVVLAPGFTRGGLTVGVGQATAAEGLRGAVTEARHARRLAADRADPVSVVGPGELASHALLLAAVPDDAQTMFREHVLGPLHAYDEAHGAELIRTLETFLRVSCSWARCAEQMHLHVNSVRYRIQRIERLTGRDLARLEDRVDFFLALRLR